MSDSGLIRILTVDDHALPCNGIAGLVNAEPDMKTIGQAATGREAASCPLYVRERVTREKASGQGT
jgi:DNA-binding NarL/FixJ family response regulator